MTPQQKNYFVKIKQCKARILKVNKNIKATSGIYMFWRTDEIGIHYCYIGQSNNVLRRCAEHLMQFQKIDNSIRAHGLFGEKEHGYYVKVLQYCEEKYLDELEKKWIRIYNDKPGVIMKNVTSGGQDSGRTMITEPKPAKKYKDGLKQGYKNAIRDVKEYFDKYLKFVYKDDCFKKNGEVKEIYFKKRAEFDKLLKDGKNNGVE